MAVIHSKYDVLTVLIHLGYLSYNWKKDECYIPNREVWGEMVNAVKANKWKHVTEALEVSEQLLQDTLNGNEEAVARGIDADTAIDQIHRRQYPAKVAEHTADLLLVGINYDRETEQHTCHIEKYDGDK